MTVYVIKRRDDESGLVKIGFTENLDRRLYDFSTAFPEGFDIVHKIESGRAFEKHLHKIFEGQRVAREWFNLSAHDIQAIAEMDATAWPSTSSKPPYPTPDDEFSEDIVRESRFYLNELVRREWAGMGDTIEAARDRVMVSCELPVSQGVRLWHKSEAMKDVSGQVYRNLRLKYAYCLKAEGRLNDNQARFIKTIEHTAKLLETRKS